MQRIVKILWAEGPEIRSLKDVELVGEDDDFVTVRTSASDFRINKKFVIKIEQRDKTDSTIIDADKLGGSNEL